MARFELKLSHKGDSDWAVWKDGVAVAFFAGTNAAERWIAQEKEIDRAARRMPISAAERRRIHALLR
jgi:hypothetical protein